MGIWPNYAFVGGKVVTLEIGTRLSEIGLTNRLTHRHGIEWHAPKSKDVSALLGCSVPVADKGPFVQSPFGSGHRGLDSGAKMCVMAHWGSKLIDRAIAW